MSSILICSSLLVIVLVLVDGFEAMLLPRRVTRKFRFARLYYRGVWSVWSKVARWMPRGKRRESFLSLFGPLSIVVLFSIWATGLIVGFAVLHQSLETRLNVPPEQSGGLDYIYMSGVIFFTLGFGDVTPVESLGRMIAVVEAGIGFGFLAAVIGYLPVLYAAFSRREISISLLDARAGSPPTGAEILIRVAPKRHFDALERFLIEWERWGAEVLESHLSFPVLPYYRSQHDNQSWLASLTAVLDACALILSKTGACDTYQTQLTFAMARHAVVDLAQIFSAEPTTPHADRLTPEARIRLYDRLRDVGMEIRVDEASETKFAELRSMYEPFVTALAEYFVLTLPPILAEGAVVDNWQTSAWMRKTEGIGRLLATSSLDDHDD